MPMRFICEDASQLDYVRFPCHSQVFSVDQIVQVQLFSRLGRANAAFADGLSILKYTNRTICAVFMPSLDP